MTKVKLLQQLTGKGTAAVLARLYYLGRTERGLSGVCHALAHDLGHPCSPTVWILLSLDWPWANDRDQEERSEILGVVQAAIRSEISPPLRRGRLHATHAPTLWLAANPGGLQGGHRWCSDKADKPDIGSEVCAQADLDLIESSFAIWGLTGQFIFAAKADPAMIAST